MNKSSRTIAIIAGALACASLLLLAASPVLAQVNVGLEPVGRTIGLSTQDIRVTIANIIQVFLGILGIVLVVILVYAGFMWMTAGGDEAKVQTAGKWIKNGIIGLIIILASYAITVFIVSRLLGATGAGGGPNYEQGVINNFGDFGTGSLGEGVLQAHFPPPGAIDVPRNTKIIVTFKVPVDPATLIENGKINAANVRILETKNLAAGGAFQTSSDLLVTDVNAYKTTDNKTYVFSPVKYLGSPTDKISYTVALGTGINLADGGPAFNGSFSMGYRWEFETGTTIDVTPPKVVSVYPRLGSAGVPRNSVIQINFNEAVDPVVATGAITTGSDSFKNITVTADGSPVTGAWEIGNQYRTVEFRSNVLAGQNSCGFDIFVLPANAALSIKALAATLSAEPPTAAMPYPFDGVTDVASNSLDGNGNNIAEGPAGDSVAWNFSTSAEIDTTPPKIDSVEPEVDSGGVKLDAPVAMTFSKPLSITTVNNKTMSFGSTPSLPLWYFGAAENLDGAGKTVTSMSQEVRKTKAIIVHERLAPAVGSCIGGSRKGECSVDTDCPGGRCHVTVFNYYPDVNSGVQDVNQNCFLPACGTNPTSPYCCPVRAGDGSISEISCARPCQADAGGRLYCAQ